MPLLRDAWRLIEGASNGLHDDEIANGTMYNSGMGLGLRAILDMLLFPHVKFAVHGCVTKRTAWDTRLISFPGRLDAMRIAWSRQFPCFVRLLQVCLGLLDPKLA